MVGNEPTIQTTLARNCVKSVTLFGYNEGIGHARKIARMTAIEKQVQLALAKSQAASGLTPYAYMLARQLGLYYWLASKTRRFGSIGQEVIMSGEFLHREFWHTYEVVLAFNRLTVAQAWIVETSVLAKEFPYEGQHVVPDPQRPNLYIAQHSGMPRRVILEIDADETAILHAILRRKSTQHYRTIVSLTDDKDLQEQVKLIYGNIIKRLQTRSIPYTLAAFEPNDDTIYLPFPLPESEDYPEKLSWMLERSGHIEVEADAVVAKVYREPQWQPKQVGDVARRLRDLDMISETGSIRGVYDEVDFGEWESDFASRWEKLNLLERAEYEQRIVGCGTLSMNGEPIRIIAIMRDRLNDAIGQQFIIRQKKKQLLVTIDLHGENESVKYFKEDMMTYFNSTNPAALNEYNLEEACETWEDGLRVHPMLNVLFKVVEMQQSFVSPKSIFRTLQVWLGKETSEETAL